MRIHIDLPDTFLFEYRMVILPEHENTGGHLAHDKVVTLVGDCRDAWFGSMGFAGCRVGDVGIVNTDLALMYIAQAYHGEQVCIRLAFSDPNKYGGDMLMCAVRDTDGREIFRAKSGFVFLDYNSNTVKTMPPEFLAALTRQGYQAGMDW